MLHFQRYVLCFLAVCFICGCQENSQDVISSVEVATHKTDLFHLDEGGTYPSGRFFLSADTRTLTYASDYEKAIIQKTFSTGGKEVVSRKLILDAEGPYALNRLYALTVDDSLFAVTDGVHLLLQDLQRKDQQTIFSLYPERTNSLLQEAKPAVLTIGNQWGGFSQSPSSRLVFVVKKPIPSIRRDHSIELLVYDLNSLDTETLAVSLPGEIVEAIYACNPNLLSPQIFWSDTTIWVNFQLFPDIFRIDTSGQTIQFTPQGSHQLNDYIPKGQIEPATPQSYWPDPYPIFGSIGYDPIRQVYVQWLAGPTDPANALRQRYLRIMDKQFRVLGEIEVGDKEKYGSVIYFLMEGIFIEAMDRQREQTIAGYQVLLHAPQR